MNKKTKKVEDLNVSGSNLTVYKDYLYYIDKNNHSNLYRLYRINLNNLDEEPELVHNEIEPNANNYYYIANDLIYLYPAYLPVFSISVNDFSQTVNYSGISEKYFMAGIDEKYRYILKLTIENDKNIYTLARCLHKDTKFENKEDLFDIIHPESADLRFNDFLVVNNGFVYYCFGFDIYKCELKVGAESEIIYKIDEFGDERFELVAVTDDGIYIKKSRIIRKPAYDYVYDKDYIYRLDFDGNNEAALKYPQFPYFVSNEGEDEKLVYINEYNIYTVE